jgi:hypothetical protein
MLIGVEHIDSCTITHTHTHTYTHGHACIYVCIYTYTHTCIYDVSVVADVLIALMVLHKLVLKH